MAYCPSCSGEVLPTDTRCAVCGADFSASGGWKPLDAPPKVKQEGRPLRWWQNILWFIAFWFVAVNLFKLLGADAVTQIGFGIIGGIFGAYFMNVRARKRPQKHG